MTSTFDWSQRLSKRSKHWQASAIRGFFPLEARPGMISVLGGKPNPSSFPFAALTLELKPIDGGKTETLRLEGEELANALQYGATAGMPQLVEWLSNYQKQLHGRENDDWSLAVGAGSGDLLAKVFLAITNPGDAVILESQAYGFAEGFLRTIEQFEDGEESSDRPHSLQVFDCPGDGEGLQPDKLLELLEGWPQGKPMPKLLYTVPTGSNPTGATLTEDRRRKVLKICHRFGIPILEDDPYYPIFYSDKPRPRSFFSLEKEVTGVSGLVIRSDSFSKILSSGMRLAFLSGPPAVVDAVVTYASNTNLQPPSTTQGIALKLLQHWGPEGLIAHCERVAAFYKRRRDVIEALAKESLSDIAEWTTPEAGMFLFIKLEIPSGDSLSLIREKAVEAGFLAAPGAAFMKASAKSSYVRISFSLIDEESAREGFKRLREVVLAAQNA